MFYFLALENGSWGEWTSWGACSKTCGTGGTQTRQRACNNPSPKYGGKKCDEVSFDSQLCFEKHCPS